MSRNRLIAKIRENEDFCAITRYLDERGHPWRLLPMGKKKHPKIEIDLGDQKVTFGLTCTPSNPNPRRAEAQIRRFIDAKTG